MLTSILASFWKALDGDPAGLEAIEVTGIGALPSTFAVTDFASAAVAVAAAAMHWTQPATALRSAAASW